MVVSPACLARLTLVKRHADGLPLELWSDERGQPLMEPCSRIVGSFFKIVEEDKKKNGSKVKKNILVVNSRLKALETRSLFN